jgi:hypothetical protein
MNFYVCTCICILFKLILILGTDEPISETFIGTLTSQTIEPVESFVDTVKENTSFVHREVKKYKTKGKTEPILSETYNNNNNNQMNTSIDLSSDITVSIHDRLAALKKNEDWRKRNTIEEGENNENINSSEIKPKSIISKISELQLDSESWRKRVPENDAKKFTVASKLDSKLKTNLTENIQSYLSPGSMTTSKLKKLATLNSGEMDQSIESLDNIETVKRDKLVPDYKRVILNRDAEMINIGAQFYFLNFINY